MYSTYRHRPNVTDWNWIDKCMLARTPVEETEETLDHETQAYTHSLSIHHCFRRLYKSKRRWLNTTRILWMCLTVGKFLSIQMYSRILYSGYLYALSGLDQPVQNKRKISYTTEVKNVPWEIWIIPQDFKYILISTVQIYISAHYRATHQNIFEQFKRSSLEVSF